MNYRTLSPIDEKISLLGYGAMRFPTNEDGTINRPESIKMLDYAYNHGVNYFDTAYMYHDGESQSFLGEAMKKYDRESFFITNKMPVWMAEEKSDIARIFEDQLQKCQVEYFDFYLIHAVSREKVDKIREFEVYNYLSEQKAKGRIKYLGFSYHDDPANLELFCAEYKFDFVQLQINYLDWGFQKAKEQYDIAVKYGLPCIIMEPVRGGALANLPEDVVEVFKTAAPDRSVASWAVRFCASLPNVLTILSGMTQQDQVEDNLATLSDFEPLTAEEQAVIDHALEVYKKNNFIPCTECKYCIDCPVKVNIPDIFKLYNMYRINKNAQEFVNNMAESVEYGCVPSECIGCGACMEKCPQHINIPEELARIDAMLTEFKK